MKAKESGMKSRFLGLLAVLLLAVPFGAGAAQVDVTYSVSGSSGNWLLDFSVTNNISSTSNAMNIYFFGVRLPGRDIQGSPSGWDPDFQITWDNSLYGGTDGFNNNWLHAPAGGIPFGSTLSGFHVGVNTVDAPTNVDWFAYGYGSAYTGSFNDTVRDTYDNPGFEGSGSASVPEPGTLALLGLGLLGLGVTRRKAA